MICPMCLNCLFTEQNALVTSSFSHGRMNPSTPAAPGAEYLRYHRGALLLARSTRLRGFSWTLLLSTPRLAGSRAHCSPSTPKHGSFVCLSSVAIGLLEARVFPGAPPHPQADAAVPLHLKSSNEPRFLTRYPHVLVIFGHRGGLVGARLKYAGVMLAISLFSHSHIRIDTSAPPSARTANARSSKFGHRHEPLQVGRSS